MSFEERIRQAVGRALDDVRTRMEQEVRILVQDLAASAAEDRQLAIAQSRDQTLAEARRLADQRVAEAEAHLTSTIDRVVADACAREREQASAQARREADADMDARARRLLEAVRALDAAGSLSEVLDALGAAIAREAGRSAVFIVRGESFQGWALSGFGSLDAQPGRLDVPIAQAPLVQRAIQTGRTVASAEAEPAPGSDSTASSFTTGGQAVPLVVADRVAAVVYADALTGDGREAVVSRGWASNVELLARHGARCIAALEAQPPATAQPATPRAQVSGRRMEHPSAPVPAAETSEASARRLARLLISEIKLHNEPKVDEGRRAGNLLARLAPQIERARRVYDARVPVSLVSRAQLFQQELVTTLADGDASRLGGAA
jgi:hypothetical protein